MNLRAPLFLFVSAAVALVAQVRAARADVLLDDIATNTTYTTHPSENAGLYDSETRMTWVCWNGPDMDVYVQGYSHDTNTWGAPKVAAEVNKSDRNAYHDYPMMIMAPDKRLIIFYAWHTHVLYMVKAPLPQSIDGTWPKPTIIQRDLPAYPKPQVIGNKIYLFYNHSGIKLDGTPYRPLRYMVSSNNGEPDSWSQQFSAVDTENLGADGFDEVYLLSTYADQAQQRVHLVWKMAGGDIDDDGDGDPDHNAASRNVYYTHFRASNSSFYCKDQNLGARITNDELFRCLVVQHLPADHPNAEVGDRHPVGQAIVSVDSGGLPVIAYSLAQFIPGDMDEEPEIPDQRIRTLRWARWNGSNWKNSTIITGTDGLYDMERLGGNSFRMAYTDYGYDYLMLRATDDLGTTWYDIAASPIPFGQHPDGLPPADVANVGIFIENGRSPVEMLVQTHYAPKKKDEYGGDQGWPVLIADLHYKQGVVEFSDTFNATSTGAAPPHYTLALSSGTSAQVADIPSTTDKSLRFKDNTSTGSAKATRWFPSQTDVAWVAFSYMQPNISHGQKMHVRSGSTVVLELIAGGSGENKLFYTDAAGNFFPLATYTSGQFQRVVVAVNVLLDTCDILVNGAVVKSDLPLRAPVDNVDSLVFSTGTAAGGSAYTQYIDNVYVTH